MPREAVCLAVSSRVRRNFGEKFASRYFRAWYKMACGSSHWRSQWSNAEGETCRIMAGIQLSLWCAIFRFKDRDRREVAMSEIAEKLKKRKEQLKESPLPFWTNLWNHVSRSCNLIGWSIDRAQPDSHSCRKRWGICLTRQKTSNMLDIFLTATRENGWANCLARHFAQLFPHVCGGL